MGLRILLVDDDDDIRESLVEFLELEGHVVVGARNGVEALGRLETMGPLPDLILLDLMMPLKDGFQFRAEQRADPRFAAVPVVVMSADPRLDDYRATLEARGYLAKPFDLKGLRDALAA